jgi:hypothetical protein
MATVISECSAPASVVITAELERVGVMSAACAAGAIPVASAAMANTVAAAFAIEFMGSPDEDRQLAMQFDLGSNVRGVGPVVRCSS